MNHKIHIKTRAVFGLVVVALMLFVLHSVVQAQSMRLGESWENSSGRGISAPVEQDVPSAPTERYLTRTTPERASYASAWASGASAASAVVQIPAVADAYISSNRPDDNFGADALFVGYNLAGNQFGAERVLLRFNLDSIPENAQINDARLRLHLSVAKPAGDNPMRTIIRRLNSEWDELNVTWNTEPQWASVRDSTFVGSQRRYYEWEIPDLVQGWVDGSFPNFGIEIIGDERVQQRERVFYARETTSSLFPQLVVDYSIIDDTTPPDIQVNALPDYVGRSFVVTWSGGDAGEADIDYFDVQYRVDGGEWVDWQQGTLDRQEEFSDGEDGRFYEFRARGVDEAGNVEPFEEVEASTTVDLGPPRAVVLPLPAVTRSATFTVQWQGNDGDGAGIRYYDVRYRVSGGPWVAWQARTLGTSEQFAAEAEGLYEFEARAVDNANRVEPFTGREEASVLVDTAAPFVTPRVYLPLIVAQ